jgi:hypothetical protein
MRALAVCVAAAVAASACRRPEQPLVPPRPTDPTNALATYDPTDVIDASIVKDAGPILDAAVANLDSAVGTPR